MNMNKKVAPILIKIQQTNTALVGDVAVLIQLLCQISNRLVSDVEVSLHFSNHQSLIVDGFFQFFVFNEEIGFVGVELREPMLVGFGLGVCDETRS